MDTTNSHAFQPTLFAQAHVRISILPVRRHFSRVLQSIYTTHWTIEVHMSSQPLPELTEQSAGVGAWILKVSGEAQASTYPWNKNGKSGKGARLDWVLVSEDSTQYCQGLYKRKGQEPAATREIDAAKAKYKPNSIWKASKLSLIKENPKYLGCSCKVFIDMNTSSFQPVLQSTVQMPIQATPPEHLSELLQCPGGQSVDVLALVKAVSEPSQKTTANGQRNLVEINIFDDSGKDGAASCMFPAWLPIPTAGAPCQHLEKLKDAVDNRRPIAFFNLICERKPTEASASEHGTEAKTTLKTSRDKFRFEICEVGTKAERLKKDADVILSAGAERVTVVAELPVYTGTTQAIDYLGSEATFTVCRLLDYMIGAGSNSANETTVCQINHARILESKAGDNVYTNQGDRLFPEVLVIDQTGAVQLRMREKAALAISGLDTKEDFATLAFQGGLNFPILCSLRVTISKNSQADTQYGVNAIIERRNKTYSRSSRFQMHRWNS